ncbi:hypothetical protein FAM21834_01386 [Lentilactobacillus parabuchneri]|jgi:hypothetical protein|uniref:Lipoprotein n=1 Tax=Lentilactobacillus parabuchneri TaxID=152331 RepID=A0A1X1FEI4_9LACO|nr:hypothetical protein [Lentilactobacillus parabuchneri]APR07514.1 hypothetical protein FAM21731_01329 [Lentilactobacillus parabuchneri]MBW0223004.1 hypothetical protein [Lentilactobacillus parabuchneri]MBW0245892.1 hypothetical protein [Lentilactobacillus parabuchneri]MBW0264135.1 hypothetical protein [Lentilactobacillus parabuchneri]MCT2883634.1 hypothetical protein [Lentilactobacillus parabuchneri]
MNSVSLKYLPIKKYWLLLLGVVTIISLTACAPKTSSRKDSLTVYDSGNSRILYTTNKNKISLVSNLTSKSDTNAAKIVMPQKPKVRCRYVLHQKAHDVNINLYVYSNTRNIKMTNIPILKTIYYRLSPGDYQKMSSPESYLK